MKRCLAFSELQAPVSGQASDAGVSRLPALQVLRGLAAVLVVLFSIGSSFAETSQQNVNPFAIGAIAVDIFFVMSGFVIAYSMRSENTMLHFLVCRLARVAPLYWFLTTVIICISILSAQLSGGATPNSEHILRSYLIIPYQRDDGRIQPLFGLAWTLCYEVYFYIIFSLCLCTGRLAPWVACLLLAINVLAGQVWSSKVVLWQFYTDPIIAEFAFGILLSRLYIWQKGFVRADAFSSTMLAFGAFVLYRSDPGLPHVVHHGLVAALIVSAFLWLPPIRGRWVACLVVLGDASYALYLSHPFLLRAAIKLSSPHLSDDLFSLSTAPALVFALAIALLMHQIVERPAQAFLLRYLGRP